MEKFYHINNEHRCDPLRFGSTLLIQMGRIYCKGDSEYAEHLQTDFFELTVVTGGRGVVGVRGEDIPVKEGDTVVSFPAETHRIVSDKNEPLSYDFFAFNSDDPVIKEELDAITTVFKDPADRLIRNNRIEKLLEAGINELCDRTAPLSDRLLTNLLDELIIRLIRVFKEKRSSVIHVNTSSSEQFCYRVMNYMDSHIFSLKRLADIAEITGYNYSYLSDLFKKTTGRTLSDYYRSARLKAARILVRENKLKVSKIAELLNYSSVYVLSRAYKSAFGVPPTEDKPISPLTPDSESSII